MFNIKSFNIPNRPEHRSYPLTNIIYIHFCVWVFPIFSQTRQERKHCLADKKVCACRLVYNTFTFKAKRYRLSTSTLRTLTWLSLVLAEMASWLHRQENKLSIENKNCERCRVGNFIIYFVCIICSSQRFHQTVHFMQHKCESFSMFYRRGYLGKFSL